MAKIDDELKTRFENDKHRFVTNMFYTANHFNNLFEVFFKSYGLSSQQFNVLRILRGANDWVTMNTIKELMIHKAPNATRLSDKLVNKGLVERKRSDIDRRVVSLRITKKGLDLLIEMDLNNSGEHMKFMTRITDDEAKKMSDILDKLRG